MASRIDGFTSGRAPYPLGDDITRSMPHLPTGNGRGGWETGTNDIRVELALIKRCSITVDLCAATHLS